MLPNKPKKIREVYLDYAATTPMDKKVFKAMKPFFMEEYANPSSIYKKGVFAKQSLENARKNIAQILQTQSDTIFFNSGGTESCNTAIFGIAKAHKSYGKHIITTPVEHKAVLKSMQVLEKQGFEISYLSLDSFGKININEFKNLLRKDTILVSIMAANNETGAVYPIAEIGKEILKWRNKNNIKYPYFHSDACQISTSKSLAVEPMHVDLMTLNGSKMYGPKGAGLLYKRRGVEIAPMFMGGAQENWLRAGTENVPAIIGLEKALFIAQQKMKKNSTKIKEVRDYFWEQLSQNISGITLLGPSLNEERLPNNLYISFSGILSSTLILYLDSYGIMAGTGSACDTFSKGMSHVLQAMNIQREAALGAVRFTLGKDTTKKDIDYVMEYLPGIVKNLRESNEISS